MTTIDKKAHAAVVRARTQLIVSQPFFGCLALHLNLVEASKESGIRTCAVDGFSMWYWPDFVHALSEQELMGVVAHEVMHCCYSHMTRRGNRHPIIYNCAGDYVINADLKETNFTLPTPHLFDAKYKGMSTEEVYARIIQEMKEDPQSGPGKGDPGGCGEVMDAGSPHDKAKQDQVQREWEATVRMAVSVARAANAGQLPGFLERLVKQLKAPKMSWRDLTRQFIDQSMTKDYSWSRPNRRYISRGLIMPGFVPDALHHMIFVGDVSGSVSQELMRCMVSEIAGALDSGAADKLTVLYADTEVRQVDEYVQGDVVEAKVIAGGGTDFRDSFEWIKKNAPDAACVVYLTDMMTCSWGEDPGMPVLWGAFSSEGYLNSLKVPFGQIVHVDGPQW